MFSYKCYAWIIAEANWTPFIWKNNGKSGSLYPPSWQFPISPRGPCVGCVVLLCRRPLHGFSGMAFLAVCRRPPARGGNEAKICHMTGREGKRLCWASYGRVMHETVRFSWVKIDPVTSEASPTRGPPIYVRNWNPFFCFIWASDSWN